MATDAQSANVDLHEDRGPAAIKVIVALFVLATVAVVCRLIARRMKKATLIASDYTLLLALLGQLVTSIVAITGKSTIVLIISRFPLYLPVLRRLF